MPLARLELGDTALIDLNGIRQLRLRQPPAFPRKSQVVPKMLKVLDEIPSLESKAIQLHLLRVIQDRNIVLILNMLYVHHT